MLRQQPDDEEVFASTDGAAVELARPEIDALLEARLVGRIGCHADGETYVVPVVYAYDGAAIYAASGEGRKLRMMRANPRVCFEVDDYDESGDGRWQSVIVDGVYDELGGIAAARALALLAKRFLSRTGRRGRPRRGQDGGTVVVFRIRVERASGRAVVC